jgi:aryl-phospho-beta-D-glucosidase BglC (GH1 family)
VGFNLGGWMSQSPLTDVHVASFLKPSDFKTIAGWGFNSVRLPVDGAYLFSNGGRGTLRPERFAILKQALGWAWAERLHVVLDFHQCAWHSFADPNLTGLWTSSRDLSLFASQWEELSNALKKCEGPLWAELLNEPTACNPEDWNRAAKELARAVHQTDPERVLVVESTQWGAVDQLEALANAFSDPKVVLSFHFYEPIFFTHQRAPWWKDGGFFKEVMEYPGGVPRWKEFLSRTDLTPAGRSILEKRGPITWNREALRELLKPAFDLRKRGVPLYCGEFGVYEIAPQASRRAWIGDMMHLLGEMGAGWAYWNYKWLDFGVFAKTPEGGTTEADLEMVSTLQRGLRSPQGADQA